MTHDDCRNTALRAEMRWSLVLALSLALSLGPIACTPSTADSKEEAERARSEGPQTEAADEAAYDIPAYTGNRTVEQRLKDASLAAQIKQALVRQRDLRVFDFEPEVDGRTVTIEGDVNTRAQWAQVGRVAERVAAGRTVVNAVTIGGRPADEVGEDESADAPAGSDGAATAAVYHTVQPGESLWEIAQTYGASVQRLRGMNGLSTDNLRVGQRIRVR